MNNLPSQQSYARLLSLLTPLAFWGLVLTFILYLTGFVEGKHSFEELSLLWALPLSEYHKVAQSPGGWGWIFSLNRGENLQMLPIAILAGLSLPCYTLLLPDLWQRRRWMMLVIVAGEIGLILLSAANLLPILH